VGIRAGQIEAGCEIFTNVEGLTTARDMAIKEIFDKKCPLKITRKISKNKQEEWRCNEMAIPVDFRSGF
jgi:DNA-directed RNA polymerase subunit K/omega